VQQPLDIIALGSSTSQVLCLVKNSIWCILYSLGVSPLRNSGAGDGEQQPVLSCIFLRGHMSVHYCFDKSRKERSHGFLVSWRQRPNSLEPGMNKAFCFLNVMFLCLLRCYYFFSVLTQFVTMYYGFGVFCWLQYIVSAL